MTGPDDRADPPGHAPAGEPVPLSVPAREGAPPTPCEPRPRSLPRGRHALPREVVVASQRSRLMHALVRLLADRSVREVSMQSLARTAGVSLTSFYACFANKGACVETLAAHCADDFASRVAAATPVAGTPRGQVLGVVRRFFAVLEEDPATAHAYLHHLAPHNATTRSGHRAFCQAIADRLDALYDAARAHHPAARPLPQDAHLRAVGAMCAAAAAELGEPTHAGLIGHAAPNAERIVLVHHAYGVPPDARAVRR